MRARGRTRAALLLLALAPLVEPITIAAWTVTGLTNYGTSPYAPATLATNVACPVGYSRGSALTATGGGAASNAWGANGWTSILTQALAITGNQYFFTTLRPSAGFTVSYSGISGTGGTSTYNIRRTNAGPTAFRWQYQIGSGAFVDISPAVSSAQLSQAGSPGNNVPAVNLAGVAALQAVTDAVTFRLVAWGGSGSGIFYMNSAWQFDGTVTAASRTP
jgi:hypothetical protein